MDMLLNFIHAKVQERYDIDIVLGGPVFTSLTSELPKLQGRYYQIVFDDLFISPQLRSFLADNRMAATGTLRPNHVEVTTLKSDIDRYCEKGNSWFP